ncbi:PTS sugar transporter subunit IIA [Desulfobacula toluolica]|uniref:PtsN: predicted nitrogen regulatory protein (Enzyme IIA-NTR), associated with hyf-genes n=1 Tax=Desulfobacula toluolica (strain DSM 7467 / Tol2) TaxID=651182 RepID=K0NGQ0_DESTT|nr:PTS sugar transporter subunit IIA [Desulfobacula toluolica]CCK80115.1 PtsN: predicted nitrogen regulatory protein (enzyme IIA-NTR), associated with hyf-genes [Desulfobacula toluolica Tol2]
MEYSVFDLSKLLGVVPDTIERWVRQGKLPVSKTGATYRFHISELKKWASTHNICLNLSDEDAPEKKGDSIISLSDAVNNGGIYFDIQGNDVNSVLKDAIEKMSIIPDDFKTDLLDRLVEREQALSTGIGNAIAIPHPREQLSYLNNPVVSICFLADPVEYNALDNQPVSILFFILCPELKMHLHLLSALSFCLRDRQFISFLKSKPNQDKLIEKIEVLQKANPM